MLDLETVRANVEQKDREVDGDPMQPPHDMFDRPTSTFMGLIRPCWSRVRDVSDWTNESSIGLLRIISEEYRSARLKGTRH